MKLFDLALASSLFAIPLLHLVVAPYTKVEESFPLQATHDILVYGTPTSEVRTRLAAAYDHFSFPGAVPRTFVGPALLAGLAQPLLAVVGFRRAQFLVRAVLGAANAACLLVFFKSLRRAYGVATARWWAAMLVSQFHVCFYLTRTLPNMFAFALTTLASAFLLPRLTGLKAPAYRQQALGILVLASVIFRSEVAILLAASSLQLLLTSQIPPRRLALVVVAFSAAALALSVPVDSYFWQKPLWPELWGFYFNVVRGSSSQWGVSPWHYYFTSALPRLLVNPLALPLVVFALVHPATRRQARTTALPSLLFLAIYSLQPHKETRFVFYVVPSLTAVAALGASYVSNRWQRSPVYRLAFALVGLSVLASLAASTGMLLLSSLNYPGGEAVAELQTLIRSAAALNSSSSAPYYAPAQTVYVHADVLTCMTGLTRFQENHLGLPLALIDTPPAPFLEFTDGATTSTPPSPVLLVDKTEDVVRMNWIGFWQRFDYLLMEKPGAALGAWDEVAVVLGYDGIELLRPGSPDPLERRDDDDVEAAKAEHLAVTGRGKVVGRGAYVVALRGLVRRYTGGWWLGPRLSPRIRILKQVRSA